MPLKVTCGCGQRLGVKETLAGKTVKCPKCGNPLVLPGADATTTGAGADGAAPPPAKSAAAKSASVETNSLAQLLDEAGLTASRTGRRCPQCFSDMVPEAIICIECGFNTETGQRLRVKRDIKDGRK